MYVYNIAHVPFLYSNIINNILVDTCFCESGIELNAWGCGRGQTTPIQHIPNLSVDSSTCVSLISYHVTFVSGYNNI